MFTLNQEVLAVNYADNMYEIEEVTITAIHSSNNSSITKDGEAKTSHVTYVLSSGKHLAETDVYSTDNRLDAQTAVDKLNADLLAAMSKYRDELTGQIDKLRPLVS